MISEPLTVPNILPYISVCAAVLMFTAFIWLFCDRVGFHRTATILAFYFRLRTAFSKLNNFHFSAIRNSLTC